MTDRKNHDCLRYAETRMARAYAPQVLPTLTWLTKRFPWLRRTEQHFCAKCGASVVNSAHTCPSDLPAVSPTPNSAAWHWATARGFDLEAPHWNKLTPEIREAVERVVANLTAPNGSAQQFPPNGSNAPSQDTTTVITGAFSTKTTGFAPPPIPDPVPSLAPTSVEEALRHISFENLSARCVGDGTSDVTLTITGIPPLIAAVRAEERRQAEYRVGKAIAAVRSSTLAEVRAMVEGMQTHGKDWIVDPRNFRADVLAGLAALRGGQ